MEIAAQQSKLQFYLLILLYKWRDNGAETGAKQSTVLHKSTIFLFKINYY